MKRFLLFFVACTFAMNMASLSAYAFSCDMSQAEKVEMSCHEAEKQDPQDTQNPQNHCDGICLCQHVMIGQQAYLKEAAVMPVSAHSFMTITAEDIYIFAHKTSPPLRPPIS